MYVLTLEDHAEGVYSVYDDQKNRVIPIFQIEDDADRYLEMLEDRDYPAMTVVEMEDHVITVSYTHLTLPTIYSV